MSDKEQRMCSQAELRVEDGPDGKPAKIVGYAAVFNSKSENLGGFREIIKPGAFDRTLADKADVRGLFNHNSDIPLGRTTAGTMELSTNKTGLRYTITPPDTQAARDVMASIRRGDVDGSSFSFTVGEGGDDWHEDKDGRVTRTLTDVDLFDVGPVTFPAYLKATAAVRSLERWQKAKAERGSSDAETRKRRVAIAKAKM